MLEPFQVGKVGYTSNSAQNHFPDLMNSYSTYITNSPVGAHDFFLCVFCEHVSFTDISIIVIDFLCGYVYRPYGLDDHCVKMRMKDLH